MELGEPFRNQQLNTHTHSPPFVLDEVVAKLAAFCMCHLGTFRWARHVQASAHYPRISILNIVVETTDAYAPIEKYRDICSTFAEHAILYAARQRG